MKILKYFAIAVGSLLTIFVIILVLILFSLPGPGHLITNLNRKSNESIPLAKQGDTVTNLPEKKTESLSSPDKPAPEKNGSYSLKTEEGKKILQDLTSLDQGLANVCDHLHNAERIKEEGLKPNEFGQKMEDSVLTDKKDPMIESMKPILRFAFNLPEMKSLFKLAEEASETNDDGFFTKAEFYSKLFGVYSEMKANKSKIEEISDRGYLLFIMSKIVSLRPELANDSKLQTYCQSIEESNNNQTPFSFSEALVEFESFLTYAGVSAKEVGFDPNYRTHFIIENNQNGISFKGGWIDQLISTPQKNPPPESI